MTCDKCDCFDCKKKTVVIDDVKYIVYYRYDVGIIYSNSTDYSIEMVIKVGDNIVFSYIISFDDYSTKVIESDSDLDTVLSKDKQVEYAELFLEKYKESDLYDIDFTSQSDEFKKNVDILAALYILYQIYPHDIMNINYLDFIRQ